MMNAFEISQPSPGNFKIKGDLTFTSLTRKNLKSLDFSHIKQDITIDLSDINDTDSSALALIVEWLKQDVPQSPKITITHIPAELKTLAKLSGLDISDPLQSELMQD